jgi:hypothetical protein
MLLSFALLAATVLKGQDSSYFTNSNVFAELGAAGGISANYERLFPINEVAGFSGRAGLGIYPLNLGLFGSKNVWAAIFPLMFNFIYGRTIALEAGLGLSIGFDNSIYSSGNLVKWYNGTLGVRFQKPGRGLLIRFGFTPQIVFSPYRQEYILEPGVGISIGSRIKSKKER